MLYQRVSIKTQGSNVNDRTYTNHEFPPCGYGRAGLCCSACLLGPCRISPFERDLEKGICGVSADRLTAGNLLRMIAAETAARQFALARLVQRVGAGSEQGAPLENQETARALFDKYGPDPSAIGKSGAAARIAAEIETLLRAAVSGGNPQSRWLRLYPADAFPQFYSAEILPTADLCRAAPAAFELFQNREATLDDLLWTCIRTSLVCLICEEMIQDLETLGGAAPASGSSGPASTAAAALDPALPSAGAVLLLDGWRTDSGAGRDVEAFRKHWRGPLIEFSRPAAFFEIGRQFLRRYSRPLADAAPPVVAATPSAAQIVGILACGFTVASLPELPLGGSERVARFFGEDLKKVVGSFYLAPEGGDILTVMQNRFGKKL